MKRIILFVLIIATVLTVASCDMLTGLGNTVVYPDAYSITYEVTSRDGVVESITKTVDEDGNVYLKDFDAERLYIKDGSSYTLYEKSEGGKFVPNEDERYTASAVNTRTNLIDSYAKESLKKFMPTAKKDGAKQILERDAEVYKLGVGIEGNGAYYYYFVDKETGICLGVEARHEALGNKVEASEETFIATDFRTDGIPSLSELIK